MDIKPDPKLYTKQWLVLATVSLVTVLSAAIIHLIVILAEGYFSSTGQLILWSITLGLIALMWLISVPIIKLWVKNLSYMIQDDRITIYKGFLTKVQQNIPYRAVTDFMLQRTLFDRYLGIGSICIQTAGQSQNPTGFEGRLSGLNNYTELHQELRNRLKRLHPKGEALAVKEPEASDNQEILGEILVELKAIRSNIEK